MCATVWVAHVPRQDVSHVTCTALKIHVTRWCFKRVFENVSPRGLKLSVLMEEQLFTIHMKEELCWGSLHFEA